MNADDFEQKLGQQKLRPIPAEWRAEILSAANAARQTAPVSAAPASASSSPAFLSALFWPSPKAWAGLAAIWLVILGLNHSARDNPQIATRKSSPSTPDLRLVLKEQQRLLAELAEPREAPEADRPKPTNGS